MDWEKNSKNQQITLKTHGVEEIWCRLIYPDIIKFARDKYSELQDKTGGSSRVSKACSPDILNSSW